MTNVRQVLFPSTAIMPRRECFMRKKLFQMMHILAFSVKH